MSNELNIPAGKRKYLKADETADCIAGAKAQGHPELRSFALVLAYTGCRITEALEP